MLYENVKENAEQAAEVLSILYLRCVKSALRKEAQRQMAQPFNSLFEMQ